MSVTLPIYLDYNATTPVAAEVADAMLPFLREHFGNPSSLHTYGRIASQAVAAARAQVAALIGARSEEIVFTGVPPKPTTWRCLASPEPFRTRSAISSSARSNIPR